MIHKAYQVCNYTPGHPRMKSPLRVVSRRGAVHSSMQAGSILSLVRARPILAGYPLLYYLARLENHESAIILPSPDFLLVPSGRGTNLRPPPA